MENQINLEGNKIVHLKHSMVMHGIYNSDTLEKWVNTVHKMHNKQLGTKIYLWVNSIIGINGIYLKLQLNTVP